jgi:hypothetical protein
VTFKRYGLNDSKGRDKDGQVLNLSGQLRGKFHQHLDARYVVPSLDGHFVPIAEFQLDIYMIPTRDQRLLKTHN